jgi:hypothetical protein
MAGAGAARRGLAVAFVVAGLLTSGCSPRICTAIGGTHGLTLGIPASLYVERGSVRFEVCDDEGCEHVVKELARLPGDRVPQIRGSAVDFTDLGREFDPGTVEVAVELVDKSGETVARRTESVELSRTYPNGKDCDGDGFVHGGLELEASDAV